jgi:hypothetical protein
VTAGSGTAQFIRAAVHATSSGVAYFLTDLRAFMAGSLGVIVMIFICAWLWYQAVPSPSDTYRPAPASSIKPGAVSGAPCPNSSVASAWLSNDAGGNLYTIVCGDGTIVPDVAR